MDRDPASRSRLLTVVSAWVLTMLVAGALAAPIAAQDSSGQATVGKHRFRSYCSSCHGLEARGDGPVAEHLLVQPTDLTQISADHDGQFPTERIHRIIDGRVPVRGHGNSEMPIWGDAFKKTIDAPTEEDVRQKIETLVQYLESIQETDPDTEAEG